MEGNRDTTVQVVWSPNRVVCTVLVTGCRKYVIKLEREQKRFTRMVPGLVALNCKERLVSYDLFYFGVQEADGYLIEMFEIMIKHSVLLPGQWIKTLLDIRL